jgi:hypothetical protein
MSDDTTTAGPVETRLLALWDGVSNPPTARHQLSLLELARAIDRLREETRIAVREVPRVPFSLETDADSLATGSDERTKGEHRSILDAAKNLFDNRLGWSRGRNPYAPREFWASLGAALYGDDDYRVCELCSPPATESDTAPTCGSGDDELGEMWPDDLDEWERRNPDGAKR